MALKPGDWVLLSPDRVGQVQEIAEGPNGPIALALDTRGEIAERPLANAELRWRVIPADGVTVRLSSDPSSVTRLAAEHPVDLVVAALTEIGGAATVKQVKSLLVPAIISTEEWPAWWRRTQGLVAKDDRIDPSGSAERRYRLLRPGEARFEPDIAAVTVRGSNGRSELATRALRGLAARVRGGRQLSPSERSKLEQAVAVAQADATLDATDRYLALVTAVDAGVLSSDEAQRGIGDSILDVDLLRLAVKSDRERAMSWADALDDIAIGSWPATTSDGQQSGPPTIAVAPLVLSAAALGPPLEAAARDLAGRRPGWIEGIEWAVLGWSPPGSREGDRDAGAADLRAFGKRLERARRAIGKLDAEGRAGLVKGAERAVDCLLDTSEPSEARRAMALETARLAWDAARSLGLQEVAADIARLGRFAMEVFVESAPATALPVLRGPLVARYLADRVAGLSPLIAWCRVMDQDPGALMVRLARDTAVEAGLGEIAAQAASHARSAGARAESVALAVTLGSESDPAVSSAVSQQVGQLIAALDESRAAPAPPVILSGGAIEAIVRESERRRSGASASIASLIAERDAASGTAHALEAEVDRLRVELRATKGSRAEIDRASVHRLAGRILRPFALALADSYESKDLGALQDSLIGLFERGGVRLTIDVGERQEFDPRRHRWVGEGHPTRMIRALSPGFEFVAGEELGADEIVVVPARVVAADTAV